MSQSIPHYKNQPKTSILRLNNLNNRRKRFLHSSTKRKSHKPLPSKSIEGKSNPLKKLSKAQKGCTPQSNRSRNWSPKLRMMFLCITAQIICFRLYLSSRARGWKSCLRRMRRIMKKNLSILKISRSKN